MSKTKGLGKTKSSTTCSNKKDDRCPFQRINPDDGSSSPADYLDQFLTHGFLWLKGTAKAKSKNDKNDNPLADFCSKHTKACQARWTVENRGDWNKDGDITPKIILHSDDKNDDKSFYASTIIPLSEPDALADLLKLLPTPFDFLPDVHLTGGAWIFCGRLAAAAGNATGKTKKRKRPLVGRAEHVDEVPHSGTWHYQLKGNKTWLLRPHAELFEAQGKDLPDLESTGSMSETTNMGSSRRLRITVEEGDWFVLNTRIWYHCTELEYMYDNNNNHACWSISVARDFYLPVPCPENVQEGQVIFQEEDIPDDMPRTLTVEDVNCALAEVELENEEQEEEEETCIVLVATRHIQRGELLFLLAQDNNNDNNNNNNNEEYNANETVDPRAVAIRNFIKGDVVLVNDEIPDDLPRSMDPNCELQLAAGDDDDTVVLLKARRDIAVNQVLCILPDDEEEYETVEVDLATGDLKRIE